MPSLDENLEPAEGALRSDEGAWLHRGDPVPLQADLAAGTSEPLSARQIVRPGIPTAPVQPYERLPDFDARRLAERNVYPTR